MEISSLKDKVSDAEWRLRVDLAACYRLVALYGWTDLVFTHISVPLPSDAGENQQFLLNPYGLLFEEITASSLIRIDAQGNKLSYSPFPVTPAGFTIHSSIHEVREDAQCVLHTHTRSGVGVSAQACGLLPISQQSIFVLNSLAYHDYEGVALRDDEKPRLQANLGNSDYLMLRNHGLLVVGRSVADAFLKMYTFENACRIQIDAQAGGKLIEIDPAARQGIDEVVKAATSGMGAGIAWPALLRKLDRVDPSYKN